MNSSAALKAAMRESLTIQLHQANTELRALWALMLGGAMFDSINLVWLLVSTPDSMVYRAALATSFGPNAIAIVFAGLAVLLLPLFVQQVFAPHRRDRRVSKLAAMGLALAGLAWIFLGYRLKDLDLVGGAPWVFWGNGAGAMLCAIVLAATLNAEQLRTLLERPQ